MAASPIETDKVTVRLSEGRSYEIVVGNGLMREAGKFIVPLLPLPLAYIVTDKNVVQAGLLKQLKASLKKHGIATKQIILNPGEGTKSFASLNKLLNKFLSFQPERKVTLIALGGGVIGDITGFAASVLLRGVNYIQIPTTLLAMVDSSVGGKTGINTKYGKNLVGSFYQPKLVLADLDALTTLPRREFLAGYAEVVKYGLINAPEFFVELEKAQLSDGNFLRHCVTSCCRMKAEIVGEDEREAGNRALLNLGHTFGHALEAEMGYDGSLLHGEAVAIGMVMAFQFSEKAGLSPAADTQRVIAHLKAVGLPVSPQELGRKFEAEILLRHMQQDKKVQDGKLVLILTRGIGKAFIQKNVEADAVLSFLKQISSVK